MPIASFISLKCFVAWREVQEMHARHESQQGASKACVCVCMCVVNVCVCVSIVWVRD